MDASGMMQPGEFVDHECWRQALQREYPRAGRSNRRCCYERRRRLLDCPRGLLGGGLLSPCPNCGAQNPQNFSFCSVCAHALSEAALVAAPPAAALQSGPEAAAAIEGAPAVLLGLLALKHLPNGPHDATWLSGPDRKWLQDRLAADESNGPVDRRHSILALCGFYLRAFGIWGSLGPFWAVCSTFSAGRGRAVAVASIYAVGNVGFLLLVALLNLSGLTGTAVFMAIALVLVGAISVILGQPASALATECDGRRLGSVAAG